MPSAHRVSAPAQALTTGQGCNAHSRYARFATPFPRLRMRASTDDAGARHGGYSSLPRRRTIGRHRPVCTVRRPCTPEPLGTERDVRRVGRTLGRTQSASDRWTVRQVRRPLGDVTTLTRPSPKLTAKFQFWLSPAMLAALNAESEARDVASSDIVRDAIAAFLPPINKDGE